MKGTNHMTTYYDLATQYGLNNIKHLGNKVIIIDQSHKQAIGYTIESYSGYTPDALKEKIYTDLSNLQPVSFDNAYDFLYGTPDGTILPDFTKAIKVINS